MSNSRFEMSSRDQANDSGRGIRQNSAGLRHLRSLTTSATSPSRIVLAFIFFLATLAITSQALLAAGHEVVNRDEDIVLQVDSRWPGSAYGGYFPLRIKLSNMGPPRDLMLVFKARDNRRDNALPEVRRYVRIEQQATINFTLSIPVVTKANDGELRVYEANGSELERLMSRHSLPDFGGHQPRNSLLVISSENYDDKILQPFEDAAATECAYLSGTAGSSAHAPTYYAGAHYSGQAAERDHVVVQPTHNLPVNWIDYSGVDLVAVAWPDWNTKLSAAEREAILKWTATGGVLMLFGTGQPAAKFDDLNRSLQLKPGAVGSWIDCNPDTHRATNIITAQQVRTGMYPPGGVASVTTTVEGNATPDQEAANLVNKWKIDKDTYSQRDWSLGRIYVFTGNPFPGTAADWTWWLSSLPADLSQWPRKMGQSSRSENAEFLNFLIPGVGSVPVFAFLTLITLFTVIIGPLNYYWLLKRRRLAVMVFTVPLIAGVTCLLLFAYSLVADGFSTRSRVNSFTWIDQERKSAVSDSRICLYAPFAPSAGLIFPPECAILPIWPASSGFENGVLDWSGNDQRLTSGWFRSQTWTQFQALEHRDERGRLDYTLPSDPSAETLTVSNGLAWDLDYVAINTSGSVWYAGEKVPAGATAQLNRQESSAVNEYFVTVLGKKPWEYPAGVNPAAISSPMYGGSRSYRFFGANPAVQTSFNNGPLRRHLPGATPIDRVPKADSIDWRDGRNTHQPQAHMATQQPHYWAISRTSPGIQTGVKSSVDQGSLHVLFGTF